MKRGRLARAGHAFYLRNELSFFLGGCLEESLKVKARGKEFSTELCNIQ